MAQLANKIKDHFLHPRNVGKLEDATLSGNAGDPVRGSKIKLFINLDRSGMITQVRYQIFNNAPAIAAASAFSEMIIEKSIDQALQIKKEEVLQFLDADAQMGANLRFDILDAFSHAVAKFHGEAEDTPEPPATTTENSQPEKPAAQQSQKPKLMIMQLIQDVLDSEIRPAVAMDGGDVELVNVEEKRVFLRLHGHCVGCSSSNTTMKFFIQDRLRELVDPGLEVVDTTEFDGPTHAPPSFSPGAPA